MPFNNYTELQTAIQERLARTDLASQVPDFISLCEADFNRKLNLRYNDQIVTLTTVVGQNYVLLPSGYNGLRSVSLVNTNNNAVGVFLQYLTPEQFVAAQNTPVNQSGFVGFNIYNDRILITPTPTEVYDISLRYFGDLAPLSSLNPTNALLLRYPDLYFYGSLVQGALTTRDQELLATYLPLYEKVLSEIIAAGLQELNGQNPQSAGLMVNPMDNSYGLNGAQRRFY